MAVFHLQSTRALRFPPASPLQPRLHPHALCRAVLNYTWCPEYLPNGTCALSRASPASTACEDFPEAAFSGRLSLTSRFALLVRQLEYHLLQVSRKLTQSSKKNFEMYYFMHQKVHRWTTLG